MRHIECNSARLTHRRVLDDGLVGAVVLAEHDLAGEVGRVEAVEALQEALVEVALHRER